MTRYLGPERFGLLSYSISFVGLFSAIATLGLDGIVVRNLVQDIDNRDKLLGTVFILKILGGVIFFMTVFFAVRFTSSDTDTKRLILIIAGGIIFDSFNTLEFYFLSQVKARLSSISGIISFLFSSILKIILILIHAPLIYFAIVISFAAGLKAFFLVFLYIKQKLSIKNWYFSFSYGNKLLLESWPMIFSSLMILIYMKIDQVMLKEMLGSISVGHYAVAVTLSEAWYFIPIAISQSLFPEIIKAKNNNEKFYYTLLQKLFDFVVLISFAVSILMFFLSDRLILLLYGDAFSPAATVLSIHIWAGIFVSLNNVTWKWHLIENNQKLALARLFIGSSLNIILNIILIPYLNINGAAIATLISYSFASFWGHLIFKETRQIFIRHAKSIFFYNIVKKLIKALG